MWLLVAAGDRLLSTLQQWYSASRDARTATLAAFALAHWPARGLHSPTPWQDILSSLLDLNSTPSSQGSTTAAAAARTPASGIRPAKHAVELSVLVSRAVTISRRFPQPEVAPQAAAAAASGLADAPVVSVITQQWPQLVASVGEGAAWAVLRQVSAREVLTPQQWQGLAWWAAQQRPAEGGGDGGVRKTQAKRVQALLGAAWSTVTWVKANAKVLCSS